MAKSIDVPSLYGLMCVCVCVCLMYVYISAMTTNLYEMYRKSSKRCFKLKIFQFTKHLRQTLNKYSSTLNFQSLSLSLSLQLFLTLYPFSQSLSLAFPILFISFSLSLSATLSKTSSKRIFQLYVHTKKIQRERLISFAR